MWTFHLSLSLLSGCSSRDSMSTSVSQFPISVKLSYKTAQTLNLNEAGNSSLDLVSTGSNLVVSVSGCSSGYSASNVAIASGVINLYKLDVGCIVKLRSFTLGAVNYSTVGGTDFTTWLNNDVATFKNTSGSDTIKVFVISQVTQAGVQTSDTVVYKFTDTAQSTTSNLSQVNVSTPTPLTVNGQPTPDFTLTQARFLSINPNGSANMSFTMQCGSTLSGSTLPTYACSSALLNSQLDYILIEDSYSQGTLTVAQANTAFGNNTATSVGSLIVAPGASDLNSNVLNNGGFYTSNASPLTTGNTPVYPYGLNYVFMLRWRDSGGNTLSYLYFYVTINSISTPPPSSSGCGTFFSGGSGTVGDPYQISDATTLRHVSYCTSSSTYFVQTRNIDLGGSASPWTPIPLYGKYDAANYSISNLYIVGSAALNVGLFSTMSNGASISNLTLSSVSVSGGQYVGALIGSMSGGSITNVTVSGTVTGNSISTGSGVVVGGFVGFITGGSITSSSSSANVVFNPSTSNSGTMSIGGFVGRIIISSTNASISSAAATGSITISGASNSNASSIYSGGFVGNIDTSGGYISSSITNSYATGTQSYDFTPTAAMTALIGGFIGHETSIWPSTSTIARCFSGGNMSFVGRNNIVLYLGGFVGAMNGEALTDVYTMGSIAVTGSGSSQPNIGGLIGSATGGSTTTNVYVAKSSMSKTITGGVIAGIIAANPLGAYNTYYYHNANVPANTYGATGISGITTYTTVSEMQTQSNFTGFNFSTPIWKMPSANPLSSDGLLSPVLAWQCGTSGIVCP